MIFFSLKSGFVWYRKIKLRLIYMAWYYSICLGRKSIGAFVWCALLSTSLATKKIQRKIQLKFHDNNLTRNLISQRSIPLTQSLNTFCKTATHLRSGNFESVHLQQAKWLECWTTFEEENLFVLLLFKQKTKPGENLLNIFK